MAVKKYIATADGYVDGRVIKAGEAFEADFREVVRDEKATPTVTQKKDIAGNVTRPAVYPIKRDKDGNAVTKDAKPPSWARLADDKEHAAQEAAQGDFADPVFEDMTKDALIAYCASKNIPFDAKMSKAELVAACHAETSYQT